MKITAHAERSGGWWAITVPEVRGAFTQARRLDQVEAMARSAVEDLLEIDGSTIEVTLDIELYADERRLVDDARTKLAFSEWAAKIASLANKEAVTQLRMGGMTTREVATVLGVSAGRVNQIESKAPTSWSVPSAEAPRFIFSPRRTMTWDRAKSDVDQVDLEITEMEVEPPTVDVSWEAIMSAFAREPQSRDLPAESSY